MDIVKALSVYRKAIADDPASFEILSILYKDGSRSEADLKVTTGIDTPALKAKLRELYQADFIRTRSDGWFRLSSFAEDVLSEMGIDDVVTDFLIRETSSSGENASQNQDIAALARDAEPGRARLTARSLRNLKFFLTHSHNIPPSTIEYLVFECINPSTSLLRSALDSWATSKKDSTSYLLLLGKSGERKPKWVDYYNRVLETSKQTDSCFADIFLRPGESSIPERFKIIVEFKIFNYIHSDERNSSLEFFVSHADNRTKEAAFSGIWEKLASLINKSYEKTNIHEPIGTNRQFVVFLDRTVLEKTQRFSVEWYSQRRAAKILFETSMRGSAEEPDMQRLATAEPPQRLTWESNIPARRTATRGRNRKAEKP